MSTEDAYGLFPARYLGACAFCAEVIEEGDLMGLGDGDNCEGLYVTSAPACETCLLDERCEPSAG